MISTASTNSAAAVQFRFLLSNVSTVNAEAVTLLAWKAATMMNSENAVSPIDEDGLVTAGAIQVLPTGRNAHSILADRTNRFVYSAILGANEVMQFAFDANSGKLAPLDPPAVTLEPIRDRRRERHLEAHRLGAVSAA